MGLDLLIVTSYNLLAAAVGLEPTIRSSRTTRFQDELLIQPDNRQTIMPINIDKITYFCLRLLTLWQGRYESNIQPTVLETVALPVELLP